MTHEHPNPNIELDGDLNAALANVGGSLTVHGNITITQWLTQQSSDIHARNDKPILISYSRHNREAVIQLYAKLHALGFKLWRDIQNIPGGANWWETIKQGIENCETMVLCLSPEALASSLVQQEWHYARQIGKRVVPVMVEAIDWETVPRWMRRVEWKDLRDGVEEQDDIWRAFIDTLNRPETRPRVPFMVDDLLPDFVPRPFETEPLITALVDTNHRSVAISAALKGAGGYGKTTLARAICHDPRIRNIFDDGILWVTLGEKMTESDLQARMLDLVVQLKGERPPVVSLEAATKALRQEVDDRHLLLVVDDVWAFEHLEPFLNLGPHAAVLITTRDRNTLNPTTKTHNVDAMRLDEAITLLKGALLPDDHLSLHERFRKLAVRLGEWPLMLKLVHGILNTRVADGASLTSALDFIETSLDKKGIGTAFQGNNSVARHRTVAACVEASLSILNLAALRERYIQLAIFPEDTPVPFATLGHLWNADNFDVEEWARQFYDISLLLKFDLGNQVIQLHDVFRQYLRDTYAANIKDWNQQFLESYGIQNWVDLPEDESYLWAYGVFHLIEAQDERALNLFANDTWMHARYAHDQYDYTPYLQDLALTLEKVVVPPLKAQLAQKVDPTWLRPFARLHMIRHGINSNVDQYEQELVVRAAELGLWTQERAWYLLQQRHETHALLRLPDLRSDFREKAEASLIEEHFDSDRTLKPVWPFLSSQTQAKLAQKILETFPQEYLQGDRSLRFIEGPLLNLSRFLPAEAFNLLSEQYLTYLEPHLTFPLLESDQIFQEEFCVILPLDLLKRVQKLMQPFAHLTTQTNSLTSRLEQISAIIQAHDSDAIDLLRQEVAAERNIQRNIERHIADLRAEALRSPEEKLLFELQDRLSKTDLERLSSPLAEQDFEYALTGLIEEKWSSRARLIQVLNPYLTNAQRERYALHCVAKDWDLEVIIPYFTVDILESLLPHILQRTDWTAKKILRQIIPLAPAHVIQNLLSLKTVDFYPEFGETMMFWRQYLTEDQRENFAAQAFDYVSREPDQTRRLSTFHRLYDQWLPYQQRHIRHMISEAVQQDIVNQSTNIDVERFLPLLGAEEHERIADHLIAAHYEWISSYLKFLTPEAAQRLADSVVDRLMAGGDIRINDKDLLPRVSLPKVQAWVDNLRDKKRWGTLMGMFLYLPSDLQSMLVQDLFEWALNRYRRWSDSDEAEWAYQLNLSCLEMLRPWLTHTHWAQLCLADVEERRSENRIRFSLLMASHVDDQPSEYVLSEISDLLAEMPRQSLSYFLPELIVYPFAHPLLWHWLEQIDLSYRLQCLRQLMRTDNIYFFEMLAAYSLQLPEEATLDGRRQFPCADYIGSIMGRDLFGQIPLEQGQSVFNHYWDLLQRGKMEDNVMSEFIDFLPIEIIEKKLLTLELAPAILLRYFPTRLVSRLKSKTLLEKIFRLARSMNPVQGTENRSTFRSIGEKDRYLAAFWHTPLRSSTLLIELRPLGFDISSDSNIFNFLSSGLATPVMSQKMYDRPKQWHDTPLLMPPTSPETIEGIHDEMLDVIQTWRWQ